MKKRLLDYNPHTKTATYHYYDHSTGQTHIETVQDVQAHLEQNKMEASMGLNHSKQDYFKFAHIPDSVIIKLKDEKGIDVFNKDDYRKLEQLISRDPEYKYLRTY